MSSDYIPAISVQDIGKTFPRNNEESLIVLSSVSFDVAQGEFVGLIGPSGCGKTTLLRIICGFEKPDGGIVLIDGLPQDKPHRNALMLFQDFNQLFPWKTVLQNINHPLMATGFIKNKNKAKANALKRIEDVGLTGFENSYPHELSGGMKQRAAFARALALKPRVLSLDEPFASLDSITRRTLQELTRRVCEKYGVTVFFVTHSVEEAVIMADRIIVMKANPGQIERVFKNPCRESKDEAKRADFAREIQARLLEGVHENYGEITCAAE